MFLDDGVGDGQAEPGAFADVLGREKRIEDLRLDIFRHARPVVGDFEHDGVAIEVVPRADDEHPAAVSGDHRLFGVDDQVEQADADQERLVPPGAARARPGAAPSWSRSSSK